MIKIQNLSYKKYQTIYMLLDKLFAQVQVGPRMNGVQSAAVHVCICVWEGRLDVLRSSGVALVGDRMLTVIHMYMLKRISKVEKLRNGVEKLGRSS